MTYWISVGEFTFSLEARAGIIVRASATAEWTLGRAVIVALDFYRRQGAVIDWVAHD